MYFGLLPTNPIHLLFLIVPVVLWFAGISSAKTNNITIYHRSAQSVSIWEEILFRGILWSIAISIWHSTLATIFVTSLLFGLFHLRNFWWQQRNKVIISCLYAGLIIGPLFGLVRLWSGDIYLCIALHAIHNYVATMGKSKVPNDNYLLSQKGKRNFFERIFSYL